MYLELIWDHFLEFISSEVPKYSRRQCPCSYSCPHCSFPPHQPLSLWQEVIHYSRQGHCEVQVPSFPFPCFPSYPFIDQLNKEEEQLTQLCTDYPGWDSNPSPFICFQLCFFITHRLLVTVLLILLVFPPPLLFLLTYKITTSPQII